jgi:hypothetical protein
MQRLAALVPRPRLHLIRFHGVLAPNAKLRAQRWCHKSRTRALRRRNPPSARRTGLEHDLEDLQPAAEIELVASTHALPSAKFSPLNDGFPTPNRAGLVRPLGVDSSCSLCSTAAGRRSAAFIRSMTGEGQVSGWNGQSTREALTDRSRQPPTFIRQIRTSAPSLFQPSGADRGPVRPARTTRVTLCSGA